MPWYGSSSSAQSGISPSNVPLDHHHIADNPSLLRQHSLEDETIISSSGRVKEGGGGPDLDISGRSSRSTTYVPNPRSSHQLEHGEVRTLPPWIDSVELGDDDPYTKATTRLLPPPSPAVSAKHHFASERMERRMSKDGYVDTYETSDSLGNKVPERGLFGTTREPVRGRKWDYAREGDPVIMSAPVGEASRWATFVKSSMYGPAGGEDVKRVEPEFLNIQTPGYSQPWRGDVSGDDPEKALGLFRRKERTQAWYEKFQEIMIMHPLVPLAFRLTVLATSTIALALSASIYHLTRSSMFEQSPSSIMAIVVDVIALPYIGYITWDEYTGKPLGLRPPRTKIRLILLDLFFIIFESANLSLAFQTINDPDSPCLDGNSRFSDAGICGEAKSLAAILFVALMAWTGTFTVSIFRLVERVGGRDETND